MRRHTFAALGAGVTATAAAGVLLTTGVVAASLAILVAPPVTAPAAADELEIFGDCEELRQWYVDSALPHVTGWGLGGWPTGTMSLERGSLTAAPLATEDAMSAPGVAVGNGATGTNIAEAGVDEPDVAKTDGSLVFRVVRDRLVVTDARGDEARRLGSVELPRGMWEPELLLVGDKVMVLGGTPQYGWRGGDVMLDRSIRPYPTRARTTITTVDIGDPAAPRVERTERIGGHLVAAREYDGTVRVVVATTTPDLRFVTPGRRQTHEEARAENRRIVKAATIDDWLPHSQVRASGRPVSRGPLLDCGDVRHPQKQSGPGTISVLTLDPANPAERDTTAVTAGGELVYSSQGRLYLATTDFGGWDDPIPLSRTIREPSPASTEVHAFAIDGPTTTYVASGEVDGQVRDRWSFSEHEGNLRVAAAIGDEPWNPRENAVFVLDEQGGDLVEIGSVAGMGLREEIQSVRWFGDTAVVVTFRQVDPLYTIDLSDPTAPKVLGELKIPGFSSYLHPVGGNLLLGIGQNATRRGTTTGAQAAVFDIADLTYPARVDTEQFARNTELTASGDARAFTYLPEQRVALTPLSNYRFGGTRIAVLEIGEDGTIERTMTDRVGGWDAGAVRTLPLEDGRVAVVNGRRVTLLTLG